MPHLQTQKERVIITDKDAALELVRINQGLKALIRKNQNVIDYIDKKTDRRRKNSAYNSR